MTTTMQGFLAQQYLLGQTNLWAFLTANPNDEAINYRCFVLANAITTPGYNAVALRQALDHAMRTAGVQAEIRQAFSEYGGSGRVCVLIITTRAITGLSATCPAAHYTAHVFISSPDGRGLYLGGLHVFPVVMPWFALFKARTEVRVRRWNGRTFDSVGTPTGSLIEL